MEEGILRILRRGVGVERGVGGDLGDEGGGGNGM